METSSTKSVELARASIAQSLAAIPQSQSGSASLGSNATISSSMQAVAQAVQSRSAGIVENAQGLRELMEVAASLISDFLSASQRGLAVSVHEQTGSFVLRVMNSSTGEMLRQIPSDEALRIMQYVGAMESALVDLRA
jgi:flagellar protein FlaG